MIVFEDAASYFEEQLIEGATASDLDERLWQRFPIKHTGDQSALTRLGLAGIAKEGTIRPTVAGILTASRNPEHWLPHASVDAVAYLGEEIGPGPERSIQLDALVCTGPLDEQVSVACRFVSRNMKIAAYKNIGRHDIPQYDLQAVFEALVNAVAHRDYSVRGSKVILRMFSNRLEIETPGSLMNRLTVESLTGSHVPRNGTIASLLSKCPVPDHEWVRTARRTMMGGQGAGVQTIIERSESLSRRRPLFELIDDAQLRLTIYAADAGRGGPNG